MNLKNFRFEVDTDGIALLTWDMAGRAMNVLNPDVIAELGQIVDKVASDEAIKGCVVTSGKDTFSAGADLTMMQSGASEYAKARKEHGEEEAMRRFVDLAGTVSRLYRKLETYGLFPR